MSNKLEEKRAARQAAKEEKEAKELAAKKAKEAAKQAAKEAKLRYRVSKRNFFMRLSWILLGLAAVFTVITNWGCWGSDDRYAIYLQLILPVVSCVLYMLIINHMNEKGFFLTFIPVLLGTAYLIVVEANSGKPLHSILIIAICIIVAITYTMTVFGTISSKWVLLPIFGLPLAYRIAIEDKDLFFNSMVPLTLEEALPEIAILCMITAMLFIVFAMKKRDFTNNEKPIEEVLVELEDNPDGVKAEETEEPVKLASMPQNYGVTDNEATIIEPAGDKNE